MSDAKRILVIGGAGFVGTALIPKLLDAGHDVRILDLFIYGDKAVASFEANPNFSSIKGDMRNRDIVKNAMRDRDVVIHLACISNDPSYNLNPDLGRSINHDCLPMILEEAKLSGVNRFVFASSSSVYGIKDELKVTEDLPLEPLTDYSLYKLLGEKLVLEAREPGFNVICYRPATVCGVSPRQRLDLVVNILTNHAVNKGKITVFGGDQMRANLHIEDMTDLYVKTLEWTDEQIDGKIYNITHSNHTVIEIAQIVRDELGGDVNVEVVESDDNRSYRICGDKIEKELGFKPKYTIRHAIQELIAALRNGDIPNSMTDSNYFNVQKMQEINLK